MINKKAGTYSAWIEVILFIVLFISALVIMSVSMNTTYDKNYDLSFGLSGLSDDALGGLKDYQKTVDNGTREGQSSFSSQGDLQLTSTPRMVMGAISLIWNFISGGFIEAIVNLMNLGDYANIIILIFKVLYFISLAFILLKIITKVII